MSDPVQIVVGLPPPPGAQVEIPIQSLALSGFSGYSGAGVSGYSGQSTSGYSGYSSVSGLSGYSGSGLSGYSGYSGSGVSGYSGYSGSGLSGYSGYSGSGLSGYSGYSSAVAGPSGYSGYSSVSGYSGFSGWSGLGGGSSGYSGYSGASTSGYSGYSSTSGYSGYSGKSGYSGYSGYSGSGYSGYSGYSSSSGYSGYSSSSGYSGYSGSGVSGYSGYSGSGVSGYSGYSGSGISGYSGYSGSGVSGYSGYSGSGVSGYSGYSGSGLSGYSGYSGSGLSGYSGYSSSSGYSGYSSTSGFSGYSGSGGGTPGSPTTSIQYNNAGAFGGSANYTWTNASNLVTLTGAPAANTVADGLLVTDTTAATAANQQYSPALHFTGQGWKTTATAASQAVDFRMYNVPVQGAANPTGNLTIDSQVNAGGYGNATTISTTGQLSVNSNVTGAAQTLLITATDPGTGASNYNSIVFNNGHGAGNFKNQFVLQSAGTTKYALGNDFNGNATQNFFIYDGNVAKSIFQINATSSIVVNNTNIFGWSSGDATGAIDTGLLRNAAGVVEVNNGTSGTFATLKDSITDASTGYRIGGAAANTYILTGNGTNFVSKMQYASNGSSSQATGFAADTYVAGSVITVNAGDFTAGAQYHCRFDMTKTGAGTATPIITIRIGTAGTTADTAAQTITFAAGTAVADTGMFDVYVNFRAVGASATIASVGKCAHGLAATGLTSTGAAGVGVISNTTSSTFSSTAATKIGISFNGGTSFSGTCNIVQADFHQP